MGMITMALQGMIPSNLAVLEAAGRAFFGSTLYASEEAIIAAIEQLRALI